MMPYDRTDPAFARNTIRQPSLAVLSAAGTVLRGLLNILRHEPAPPRLNAHLRRDAGLDDGDNERLLALKSPLIR
ncbi:MAG: hypothetical protein R3D84_04420 [Paracoccaceae bacterium]